MSCQDTTLALTPTDKIFKDSMENHSHTVRQVEQPADKSAKNMKNHHNHTPLVHPREPSCLQPVCRLREASCLQPGVDHRLAAKQSSQLQQKTKQQESSVTTTTTAAAAAAGDWGSPLAQDQQKTDHPPAPNIKPQQGKQGPLPAPQQPRSNQIGPTSLRTALCLDIASLVPDPCVQSFTLTPDATSNTQQERTDSCVLRHQICSAFLYTFPQ